MDAKLVSWARSVKSRHRHELGGLPVLWLFTDAARLADPRAMVALLPRGLCGVVLRHDADPDRALLGRDLRHLCRARRQHLVVAGDWRLAWRLGVGLHLRAGLRPLGCPQGLALTSSAHDVVQLRRAGRAGARLVFLSPVFATASHMGAAAMGPVVWAKLARQGGGIVAALGGITGASVRRLPLGQCRAAGAIGAFSVNLAGC